MTEHEVMREQIMELIGSSSNQRMRPKDVNEAVAREFTISTSAVNEVLKELVEEEDLVYAYRDPCSYVEIPCNGCEGGHRAARPMKVVTDGSGNPWLCDDVSNPLRDLNGSACWDCGSLAFTRSG